MKRLWLRQSLSKMLRNEHVGIVKFISETVMAAAGYIPRGVCYTDSPFLFANYADDSHVGDAIGIKIILDAHIADGWATFYNSHGTLIVSAVAFSV